MDKQKIKEALERVKWQVVQDLMVNGHTVTSDAITAAEADAIMELLPIWIPVNSIDELPDGDLWITYMSSTGFIDKGRWDSDKFKKLFKKPQESGCKILAYMPYNEPEPYKPG